MKMLASQMAGLFRMLRLMTSATAVILCWKYEAFLKKGVRLGTVAHQRESPWWCHRGQGHKTILCKITTHKLAGIEGTSSTLWVLFSMVLTGCTGPWLAFPSAMHFPWPAFPVRPSKYQRFDTFKPVTCACVSTPETHKLDPGHCPVVPDSKGTHRFPMWL